MAGTALAIIFKLVRRPEPIPPETVTRLKDLNVEIDAPLSGWTHDDDTRAKLGPPYVFVYKRGNPEAYVAFGARDYDPSSPRPSELAEVRDLPLKKLFSTVQIEPPIESSWMGEPITSGNGHKFRAQSADELNWQGEVYSISHQGIGYWWVSWCGESDFDGLKEEFAEFRNKVKLLNLRAKWTERQSNIIPYKGETVDYTILDADDIWKETSIVPFKVRDPKLDKRLRIDATPKSDRKALPDEAELRVYLLNEPGDPMDIARKFVEEKRIAEVAELAPHLPKPTFDVITGDEQGDPPRNTVTRTASVVRLSSKVQHASSADQLIVISAIRIGEKVVVVHCWGELAKRRVFETKFVQIASSLREGK